MDTNPIYPGGTQLQSFVVPFDAAHIEKAVVTYEQEEGGVILEKTVFDFTDEGEGTSSFVYRLSQMESLLFRDFLACKMQVNLLMKDGTREPSAAWLVDCGEQLHRTVIT